MSGRPSARESVYAAVTADLHGDTGMAAKILLEFDDPNQFAGAAVGLASALVTRAATTAGVDPRELWATSVAEIVAAAS